jgi:hypothetical protein
VVETLQEPLLMINESAGSFQIMEKDLMPLVDIHKKSVFNTESESNFLNYYMEEI